MLDIGLVGPLIAVLAAGDVIMHMCLDWKKTRRDHVALREPIASVRVLPMTGAIISTLLSFALVSGLILMWVGILGIDTISVLIPLFDPPPAIWVSGLMLLVVGIPIHGWSRWVRKNMASSWEMSEEHVLITSGPYRWIRHPSYASYAICFVGLFLLVPSVATTILLFGIPAYYSIAKREEELLLEQFGEEYREYMKKTGRMAPRI
ncbi:isoprenylcysteine carboxylmethyltransferase family protein [Candidatus Thorarchaeota archaeon]|nr:MAG: isoprenylcysteine carboxylmethyltransferase family protein [Candidatus Thorarchaeota archaeon]